MSYFASRGWGALTLVAILAAPASAQLRATPVASGLSAPLGFVQDPSDPTVQVILEQGGLVKTMKNGVVQATPFLDLTDPLVISAGGERGLLGLAFAPDYATSRRVFVSFTNSDGHSVIARFLRSEFNPLVADPATRFDLLWSPTERWIPHPSFGNHNGGNIAFGPDGYLYIGLGDGGSFNDPGHRAQNPLDLLGKMLRVDVTSPSLGDPVGYVVPWNNPFVHSPGVRPEIWAFGLRNPWRWSFDYPRAGSTGALLIADVGQGAFEEVNYAPMGRGGLNYGWRNREGPQENLPSPGPAYTPLRDPIIAYDRSYGRSITGGFVYRGHRLGPAYVGRYFFADFVLSRVWSAALAVDPFTGEAVVYSFLEHTAELGGGATSPSSFGVDAAGEIYVVNHSGSIHRIDLNAAPPAGACVAVDPYLASGGGICRQGTWRSRAEPSDVNGDHQPDLLFESTSGLLYAWLMAGPSAQGASPLVPGQIAATKRIVGSNDFTGDGRPDLVVQDQNTGAAWVFAMNGLARTFEQPIAETGMAWRIAATGDFDGDSFADLIWTHPSTGHVYVWFMRPSGGAAGHSGPGGGLRGDLLHTTGGTPVILPPTWKIAGAGDLDNDGRSDIVLHDHGANRLSMLTLHGAELTGNIPLQPSTVAPDWRIAAVADYNGDQHVDLVWQHPGSGDLYVWFMAGWRLVSERYVSPMNVNPIWQVTGPK